MFSFFIIKQSTDTKQICNSLTINLCQSPQLEFSIPLIFKRSNRLPVYQISSHHTIVAIKTPQHISVSIHLISKRPNRLSVHQSRHITQLSQPGALNIYQFNSVDQSKAV